jgi:TonB family protein
MTNSLFLYSFSHFGLIVLLHQFVLSKHENLQVQRLFLLIATSLGIIIPLISWNSIRSVSVITEFVVVANPIKQSIPNATTTLNWDIISLIYGLGLAISLIKISLAYINAFRLVSSFPIIKKNNWITHRMTVKSIPSFSFWNQICINPNDENSSEIEIHEMAHVQQWHSLDKLVFDLLKVVFWFNPFIYWLEKQSEITHELLADNSVIQQKGEPKKYAEKLLNAVIGNPTSYPVNSFFKANGLQKRIQYILNNNKHINKTLMKYTPFVTSAVLAISIFSAACTQQSMNITEEYDTPAVLEIENYNGLGQYIGTNIKYPESARKDSIEGRVLLKFIIKKDGTIINPKVVKSSDNAALDEEALRVIKSIPIMVPAKKNGEPVSTEFVLPITFKLKGRAPKVLGLNNQKMDDFSIIVPFEVNFGSSKELENGLLFTSGLKLESIIPFQPELAGC